MLLTQEAQPGSTAGLFAWLLLGRLVGVAVLAAGIGAYVAGLHRLAGASTAAQLRAAKPTVAWAEQLTLACFLVIFATGIGLATRTSSFGNAARPWRGRRRR